MNPNDDQQIARDLLDDLLREAATLPDRDHEAYMANLRIAMRMVEMPQEVQA